MDQIFKTMMIIIEMAPPLASSNTERGDYYQELARRCDLLARSHPRTD